MKRIIDILLSSGLLFIILPLLLLIAIINILLNKGKIFFVQERAGYKGNIFKIIKFKTMNDNANNKGELLPDGERLTIFGRFLRFSSLDELPTLWNVLLGQMSLVGPRPLLVSYNQSIKLDLIIIFKTIGQVIRGKGIHHKNHPTMEEFMGTNK